MKTTQATEMEMTATYASPEGKGWEYDGYDTNVGTGEQNYFWTRKLKNTWNDKCYTLKDKKPEGEGWTYNYISTGPSGQQRYNWSRTRIG